MIARISVENLTKEKPEYALEMRQHAQEQDGFLYLPLHVAKAIKAKHKPDSKWKGLGDLVHAMAAPIGRALGMDCFDDKGQFKPISPCGQRRDALNKAMPFGKLTLTQK